MEVTEALILKFFRQECTPEERIAVSKYFDDNPDELDKYLGEQGWEDFAHKSPLPEELSKQMLGVIEDHIQPRPVRKIISFKTLAVAASVIIVIGIAVLMTIKFKPDNAGNLQVAQTKAYLQFDTVINHTNSPVNILLSDNSEVTLEPAGKVIYRKTFDKAKRDIYLTGEALFKVAKNKKWPFMVYAANFSTTALGTSFRITAPVNSAKTTIRLFTGKVVVRQIKPVNGVIHTDVYLDPGNMLEAENSTVRVSSFKVETGTVRSLSDEASTSVNDDLIVFKNQSLAVVVNTLKKVYHINIAVNSGDISNKYFTGTVNAKIDTPYAVLTLIARVNSLKLTKLNEGYRLEAIKQ